MSPMVKMKRITLLLPEDHPLFDVPLRRRSEVGRDWLDLGRRLAAIEAAVQQMAAGSGARPASRPVDAKTTKDFLSKF